MKSLRPTKKLFFVLLLVCTLCAYRTCTQTSSKNTSIYISIYIYLMTRQDSHVTFFEETQRTRFRKEVLHYRISGHSAPVIFLQHSASIYIYRYINSSRPLGDAARDGKLTGRAEPSSQWTNIQIDNYRTEIIRLTRFRPSFSKLCIRIWCELELSLGVPLLPGTLACIEEYIYI